jgi:hypothetical protein
MEVRFSILKAIISIKGSRGGRNNVPIDSPGPGAYTVGAKGSGVGFKFGSKAALH